MSSVADKTYSSCQNYLWSNTDILGRGATAVVYKARNKVLNIQIEKYKKNGSIN